MLKSYSSITIRRVFCRSYVNQSSIQTVSRPYEPRVKVASHYQSRVIRFSIGRQHGYPLSPTDLHNLDRFPFSGIERSKQFTYVPLPIEIVYSKLEEDRLRNRYVSAELFFVYVIVPLTQGYKDFVRSLRANEKFYTKRFIQFCGPEMIDLSDQKREAMLSTLLKAFDANGVRYDDPKILLSTVTTENAPEDVKNGLKCLEMTKNGDLEGLKATLEDINVVHEESENKVLNMDVDNFFEIIYFLSDAMPPNGIVDSNIDQQKKMEKNEIVRLMISHAPHFPGYFKALISQIQRHIANAKFDSALILFEDTTKISHILKNANKDQFILQNIGRFARKVLHTSDDIEIGKRYGEKIRSIFNETFNYYEDLLYTLLLSKKWEGDHAKRLEMLTGIIDVVDPTRERIHLLYPILADAFVENGTVAQLNDLKLDVLTRFLKLGYTDLEDLDPLFMWNNMLCHLMEEITIKVSEEHIPGLNLPLKRYEEHGLSVEVFNSLIQLVQRCVDENEQDMIFVSMWKIKDYLKDHAKGVHQSKPKTIFDSMKFGQLIHQGNCQRILEMLRQTKGIPSHLNMTLATDRLINLFLDKENWAEIEEILDFLSTKEMGMISQGIDGPPTCTVTSMHLLNILTKKSMDYAQNPSLELVDYAHRLRERFPNTYDHPKQYQKSISAARNLFQTMLVNHLTLTHFDVAVDLLVKLVEDSLLILHENETITTLIVNRAFYALGWTPAVSIWMTLQNSRGLSNALFSLMEFCVKSNNQARLDFLSHHSRTHIGEDRFKSFLATAYAAQRRTQVAESIVMNNNLPPGGLVMMFRLWMALHPPDDSAVQFLEILVKHTSIMENEKLLKMMTDECQRKFTYRNDPKLRRSYLHLVDTYKIPINRAAFGRF